MKSSVTLVFLAVFASTVCTAQNTYAYTQPKTGADGWETSNLHEQHLDTTRIYKFFTQAQQEKNKLHSVVLVHHGKIVLEEYLNGHTGTEQHDMRSTTKSIRSLLLGIALDKGFIKTIDDPISAYLKNTLPTKNRDKRKDSITIRHLLTMSTGLDCNDWDKDSKGQEDKVHKKKDWIQYTLNLPMVNAPGTVSNYCSMGTLLLAEILHQASGMPIDTFAEHYLFQPLGIQNLSWGHTSNKEVIASGKRLYMTSRDMAKIGQLVLHKGRWNKKQLVSEKWITESTTPKTTITGIDYGYLWWNVPFEVNGKIYVSKTATGNGGQYIIILPELDMVAVFTGGAYNSQEQMLPFAIVKDVFIPTFMSQE